MHTVASQSKNRPRPASYHPASNPAPALEEQVAAPALHTLRRSSMYSQYSHAARFGTLPPPPPLPHQPQAHFYGAPDVDLLLSPKRSGLTAGEQGFYCGFDCWPGPAQASSLSEQVIVAGYEGGLRISRIGRQGVGRMIQLDGLRGSVSFAKILPWVVGDNVKREYPLVAVVLHGPVAETPSDGHLSEGRSQHFQTRVELWSLLQKKHVTTLLSLPPRLGSLTRLGLAPPPPDGALSIHADAGRIVVASGSSGEVWVFAQEDSGDGVQSFPCLAKVWTTRQRNHGENHDKHDASKVLNEMHANRAPHEVPILTLKGRYLAFCPPAPASQSTLRATVHGVASSIRVPGLSSITSPTLPHVNCGIDVPSDGSMLHGLARSTMQGVSKGAALATRFALQTINGYLHPQEPATMTTAPQNQPQHFPPTHGTVDGSSSKDPGLVSILDLQHRAPLSCTPTAATFKIPGGCSFVSLSPSGLALFTASRKGDIQIVWDLMRIRHTRSSILHGVSNAANPHVRQVAAFSRMSNATMVDVAWSSPDCQRIIMVTQNETAHVLDISPAAMSWPPLRRKMMGRPTNEDTTSGAGALSAVSSLWSNTARPYVVGRRRSSASASGNPSVSMQAHVGYGAHTMIKAVSQSVGPALGKMNDARKAKRLHLPRSSAISTPPSSSCVRLLRGRQRDQLYVVGAGILGIYTMRGSAAGTGRGSSQGVKYSEFKLPPLPEHASSPEFFQELDQDELDLNGTASDPLWQLRPTLDLPPIAPGTESSIPQAEIESNAPYQPFHTDRRITLNVYVDTGAPSPGDAWAFGKAIASRQLNLGRRQSSEGDAELGRQGIERLLRAPHDGVSEHIVVTTRRRKGGGAHGAEGSAVYDDGFFEDDCEVLDFASQRV